MLPLRGPPRLSPRGVPTRPSLAGADEVASQRASHRRIGMRCAPLGGVATRHDLHHACVHSALSVMRGGAHRLHRTCVPPTFLAYSHRWLLSWPLPGEAST